MLDVGLCSLISALWNQLETGSLEKNALRATTVDDRVPDDLGFSGQGVVSRDLFVLATDFEVKASQ